MKSKLHSLFLSLVLDARFIGLQRGLAELWRQLRLQKRVVHVFLQIDDPYSYLLSYYLEFVRQRYKLVEFRYYLCQSLRGDFVPEPALQAKHALADCRMLAAELGIPFLDKGPQPVDQYRRPLLDLLADEHEDDEYPQTFAAALSAYWRGDTDAVLRLIGQASPEPAATNVLVGKHQLLLRKMGHYGCATMYYGGEWYWGVDRLQYLTERFREQGLERYKEVTPELAALEKATQINLPETAPARMKTLPPLEFYFSFRSPYSYLALPRVCRIANTFGLKLIVRPVLPMVMRGMSMPRNKLRYIVRDANREASSLGMPFGKISDSLGIATERCIAAFFYAQQQGKERKFLSVAGIAAWSMGIDLATDEGMQTVAQKAGLSWPEMQAAMQDDSWRAAADSNREALMALGLWGVPAFHIGDLTLWGQDRLWLLARRIEDMSRPENEAGE